MRRRARATTAALLAVTCTGGLACAPPASLGAIGTSSGGGSQSTTSLADGGTTSSASHASPIASDFRTSMTRVNGARFVSKGHAGGRWEADVYGDANALAALRVDRGLVPVGTRLVEEHFERAGDAGAGPVFMMEKRPPGFDRDHGDWRYVAVGASGEVAGDGAIPSCVRCHGDAPHDSLFRVTDAAR